MSTLASLIADILDDSFDGTLTQEELIPRIELKTRTAFDPLLLLNLWENDEIYVSKVLLTDKGYKPTTECKWTTERRNQFWGCTSNLGAYQISDNMFNPLSICLSATITLSSPVSSLAVAPNMDLFAIGEKNGTLSIFNTQNGELLAKSASIASRVWALVFSWDGQTIASGHENGSIVLWSRNAQIVDSSSEYHDCVKALSFSPDGTNLLSTHKKEKDDSEQPLIKRWSLNPLRHTDSYYHELETPWGIQHLKDGTGFVCGGHSRFVTGVLFDKSEPLFREKKHTGTVTCLAMHPTGGVVATGAWTGGVKIWDLSINTNSKTRNLKSIEAHTTRVTCAAFSPNGRLLATGEKASQIAIWKIPECVLAGKVSAHYGWVRGVAFLSDTLLATVGSDNACRLWKLNYLFPERAKTSPYKSAQEVVNDLRRVDEEDDE